MILAHIGPSHRHDPSCPYSSLSSSDAEKEEQVVRKKAKRERQHLPKMKPRKLFKSCKIDSKAPTCRINKPTVL